MNGVVKELNNEGFTIEVRQSFGNCPKYIQARQFELSEFEATSQKPVDSFSELSEVEGAERLLRFNLEQGCRVEGNLPFSWSNPEFSPFLS